MSFNNESQPIKNKKSPRNNKDIFTSLDSNLKCDDNYHTNFDELCILNIEKEIPLKKDADIKNQNRILRNKSSLLYGNHIRNLNPKYLGKTRAFFYINKYPTIIIGPNCKF